MVRPRTILNSVSRSVDQFRHKGADHVFLLPNGWNCEPARASCRCFLMSEFLWPIERQNNEILSFERSWSGFFAAQRFKLWASRRVWSGLFDVMNSYGQWNEELTYKKWHLVLFMDAWASFAKSLFVIYWMDQANHTAIYRRFFNNPSYKMFHTS